MSEYVGKICPFCKTEIREEEVVKVCPECDIPHHEGCWKENGGCTTFGCPEQHYEEPQVIAQPVAQSAPQVAPANACTNCGEILGEGQAFCPKCGTARVVLQKNFCSKCGAELKEGQGFCAICGQKAGFAPENSVTSAINQFNAGVEKKKQKSKTLPIIIAAVLAVAVAIGVFVSGAMKTKKAEEAKKQYINYVEEFLELALSAGSNLEDISDTVQRYWHEHIYDDKHGSSIDSAILYALIDKSDEIDQAKAYDAQMKDLYAKIKSVPKEIADEDKDEIEEMRDAAKELYNVYTDFYSLATDPSGSYNTFSENNNNTTEKFLSCYRALENLLD